MSDNEKSAEPVAASPDLPAPAQADAPVKAENPPAETARADAASTAASAPGFGTFGATRGSGLARGKRSTQPAANAAPAATAGYKPTSIEVVTPQTEAKPETGSTGPETK